MPALHRNVSSIMLAHSECDWSRGPIRSHLGSRVGLADPLAQDSRVSAVSEDGSEEDGQDGNKGVGSRQRQGLR